MASSCLWSARTCLKVWCRRLSNTTRRSHDPPADPSALSVAHGNGRFRVPLWQQEAPCNEDRGGENLEQTIPAQLVMQEARQSAAKNGPDRAAPIDQAASRGGSFFRAKIDRGGAAHQRIRRE